MVKLAANYSLELANLVKTGQVRLDVFKVPPWPTLIEDALSVLPVYVHFSKRVGMGLGDALFRDEKLSDKAQDIETLLGRNDRGE